MVKNFTGTRIRTHNLQPSCSHSQTFLTALPFLACMVGPQLVVGDLAAAAIATVSVNSNQTQSLYIQLSCHPSLDQQAPATEPGYTLVLFEDENFQEANFEIKKCEKRASRASTFFRVLASTKTLLIKQLCPNLSENRQELFNMQKIFITKVMN